MKKIIIPAIASFAIVAAPIVRAAEPAAAFVSTFDAAPEAIAAAAEQKQDDPQTIVTSTKHKTTSFFSAV